MKMRLLVRQTGIRKNKKQEKQGEGPEIWS